MAKTKKTVSTDEKFANIDFPLFDAINAIDKKDYGYYDRLTEEQKHKFVPYMLVFYMSSAKGIKDLQQYYLLSTEHHANTHLFNEYIMKNPKLQWLMLCASSPGVGKQFHPWIPNLNIAVRELRKKADSREVTEYFSKVYDVDEDVLKEIADIYVKEQNRKFYFAKTFPNIKREDIEALNKLITDKEIQQYERDSGNE